MTTHEETRELLEGYALGDLSEQQISKVREHMSKCGWCSEELKRLELLLECADQRRDLSADEQLCEVAKETILIAAEEVEKPSPRPTINMQYIRRIIMKSKITKLAAVAVVLLIVGIGIVVYNSPNDADSGAIVEPVVAEKKELAEELEKVELLFASGDVKGLVSVLASDEYVYESKVAAANFLADIGDESAITELEKLSNEQIADDNPFAAAIEDIKSRTLDAGTEGTGEQVATIEQSGDAVKIEGAELLKLVPANSLFCLRINNFEYTISSVDSFLAGLSPVPKGLSMIVRMQLADLLGNPALTGLNMNGTFACFGIVGPAGPELDIYVLLPVTDFNAFVAAIPTCSPLDSEGIATISNPNMKFLIKQVGSYVLTCLAKEASSDKLAATAKLISDPSIAPLSSVLTDDEAQQSVSAPIWAYGNMQVASKSFWPSIVAQIEQMKKQVAPCTMGIFEMGKIINAYTDILQDLMEQSKSACISIYPKPQVINITETISVLSETEISSVLVGHGSPTAKNKLLGYLGTDAVMNISTSVNKPYTKYILSKSIEILTKIAGGRISDEELIKMNVLAHDAVDSLGDSMAFAVWIDAETQQPFVEDCVIAVSNKENFNKVIEEAALMWNTGGIKDYYKSIETETAYEIKSNVDYYKGVSINSMKFKMTPTQLDCPRARVLSSMYGDGFDYRWALVDGYCLMAIAGDVNSAIYDLIDTAQAGGPRQIDPQVGNALNLLPSIDEYDLVGTFNSVQSFKIPVLTMLKNQDMDWAIERFDFSSNSNIAFAGKVDTDQITFEIAVPKQHIIDIIKTSESINQTMVEVNKQAGAVKGISTVFKDSNAPVVYDLVTDPNFTSDQESAIIGLKNFAEITGGKYPSQMNLEIATKEAAQSWKEKSDPNHPDPNEEDLKKILSIGSTYRFFLKKAQENKKPAYHGDVIMEYGNAVLMRWKIDDVNYRVVYGNLTVEDVTAAELKELESRPYVNTSSYAIKPNPANQAMVSAEGIPELSWTPAADAVGHRVYFGTDITDLPLIAETIAPSFSQLPQIKANTTYYWSIDEIHADGSVGKGKVWSFNTSGKLISWWKLDETSGTTAADSSGNGNDGTLTNMDGNEWTDGVVDGALGFDGYNDYIKVNDSDSLDMGHTFTVALWVYHEGGSPPDNNARILTKKGVWDSFNGWDFNLETNYDTRIIARGSSGAAWPPIDDVVSSWAAGGWHHIVVVYQSRTATVYSDSVQRGIVTIAPVVDNNLPLYIGRYGGWEADPWNGIIDDIRIYNYALSADEIVDIYVAGAVNLQLPAIKPNPADGVVVKAEGISELSWTPAVDAVRHRIYFGTDITDSPLIAETIAPSFSQLPQIKANTTYYWSIDEIHADGSVTKGRVWSFNTDTKLISWWKLDETSGTTAADSSGNGNDGTLTNMAGDEWTDGVVDGALDFDGNNDYIKVSDSDSLDMGNTFTVALWVNYEGGSIPNNYERMLTKKAAWNSFNGWEFSLQTNYNTGITVRGSSGAAWPPIDDVVSSWAAGGWHHIVVVYQGTAATVYSDGVQQGTVAIAPVRDNDLPLYIGRYGESNIHNWNGIIDDIRIYNYALSADEIVDIYDTGAVNLQQ